MANKSQKTLPLAPSDPEPVKVPRFVAALAAFDSFFELDEPLYMLIFVWFVFAGPGRVSLDTLLAKWLGIGTQKSA